ncbi:protein PTHB1 isoform X1 [Mastomys coucha]|uniref:protein PTHB1 isoform X1 n=3 Tax=Mastomys coucha TaxID=35658 RepID=UPI0012618A41|nr:protein PTHB1 isoform X1 [Mastomys coucha]XP_031201488.1 protein PTHB1 isoform X1 [Mastomys coucha]XP_031201489.1 protein PTHB1 isoform X1 [Mastomys coucha]XP_031201490.1 protein PTHB1 isoform X1 [Mastomys coucha]XP_031201491.1 protein PTHB1 isoform X1 [Mastomys coucha]XP_031201492.1 protein PTHB1 isoform X1 [Mastomys coucha]XP_031201493.1 protein PTHB1 isoform X1 [Mastomys coucha]XP_031201494.1 protein PTHB1 isoform X1 [Mastomys coucha]
MSLFKARDWWSTVLGEKEEFDQGCLCLADVDNSGNGQDKIIVGSFMGYLRIFNPHSVKTGGGPQAEDLLLEVHLRDPVLQVEVGKFVSGTEMLHLAVLHSRKLCVYSVSGTLGNVEHGNQYQIKLMYEHHLQRTACNMTYGPFGGIKGRDLICIQSMDGMLMVFEQESYAFGRFLPGSLLPGPLAYSPRTDSFITVSSCRQVESYKYQVLAFAMDADKKQEMEQQKLGSGKRLVVDWTLNIGEQALDICIIPLNQSASSVFVLGERNFFCLKDNGQIRFMKKLDCSPSCFLPYCSVSEGTINTLVGNHSRVLHVYQDVTLKWATQLPHVPVAVRVGSLHDLKGVIVTLSDDGHLQCSYLGTDPSLFQAPKVESRELNYDELDVELKELQKIIKDVKSQGVWPLTEQEDDLRVSAAVSSTLDSVSQATNVETGADSVPSTTVKITLQNRVVLQKVKLSVYVQPPLQSTCDQFTFDFTVPDMTSTAAFSVYLRRSYMPSELEGNAVVSYSRPTDRNPDGIPRVIQCKFRLPLKLICLPGQPSKTASHKLTIDTNKSPVSLLGLFPDFASPSDDDQVNVMGFRLLGGSRVTLLASRTSQRYRIQSEQFEDLWLITNELILRLQEHFEKQGTKDFACSFSGCVPLQEYFDSIDHHFELRINGEKLEELLAERAVQFRAIQRRLLTRFRDKTPAPLQHLDTLLDGTYKQVIALADAVEENQDRLLQSFAGLKSATHLLILLMRLWQRLSADQTAILEAAFLPLQEDTQELGWEETVDAAIAHLLKTCLSKSSKEQALNLSSQLNIPKDTSRLKKHITLLCDRLAKGGRLCVSTDTAAPQAMVMPGGCTPIPESDLEERSLDDSTELFTNHKHLMAEPPVPEVSALQGVLE